MVSRRQEGGLGSSGGRDSDHGSDYSIDMITSDLSLKRGRWNIRHVPVGGVGGGGGG
jgi:hypothetical protein